MNTAMQIENTVTNGGVPVVTVGTAVVTDRNRRTMAERPERARYYVEVNSERREQTRSLFVPSSNIKVAYFEEIVSPLPSDRIRQLRIIVHGEKHRRLIKIWTCYGAHLSIERATYRRELNYFPFVFHRTIFSGGRTFPIQRGKGRGATNDEKFVPR